MDPPADKSALLSRVASTRAALAWDLKGLGHALDVPDRIRSSFRLHPFAWIAGAIAAGVAAASLLRKAGKGGGLARWRPLVLGTLGFLGNRALILSLPALREVVEMELTRWLERRRTPSNDAEIQEGNVPG